MVADLHFLHRFVLLHHESVVILDNSRRWCRTIVFEIWLDGVKTIELLIVDLGALGDDVVATVVKVNERLLEHASDQVLLAFISIITAFARIAALDKAEIGHSVIQCSI